MRDESGTVSLGRRAFLTTALAAVGEMGKDANGKLYVAKVTLNPVITFSGAKRSGEAEIAALHHKSHAECFIANSVKTEVMTTTIPPKFA